MLRNRNVRLWARSSAGFGGLYYLFLGNHGSMSGPFLWVIFPQPHANLKRHVGVEFELTSLKLDPFTGTVR